MKTVSKYRTKHIITRIFRIFAALVVALTTITSTFYSNANAATVAEAYCSSRYTASVPQNACLDGWNNADVNCEDYALLGGPDGAGGPNAVAACNDGRQQAKTNPGGGTTTPDTIPPNTSNEDLLKTLKDLRDKTNQSQADNVYGKYINGAGAQQNIDVSRAPGDNNPAIVFFNGGGWHTDDGTGQKIAQAANARGYTTFVASYRLGSSGIYYMLDDTLRAMAHVKNNAGMYGIDPDRIAIWGDSAGGSLAMRAAGTGRSGAAAAVGWSAPTNGYTALFKSAETMAIGMDHSTCVPTDANGVADIVDIINGGEGLSREDYQGGPSDNGSPDNNASSSGTDGTDIISNVLEVLATGQQISQSIEAMSKQLDEGTAQPGGGGGNSAGGGNGQQVATKLAAKKFIECLDNFNSMSPALFASAQSPPALLAGFDNDPLIDPEQAYQMRDKLRSLGIPSEALILQGVDDGSSENHLGYDEKFVAPSLDFLDKFLNGGGGAAAAQGGTERTDNRNSGSNQNQARNNNSSAPQQSQGNNRNSTACPNGAQKVNGVCAPPQSGPQPAGWQEAIAKLRQCESGGNYSINTGNDYYGAYQYDTGTWARYGGYENAHLAPPSVQDAKVWETYQARGWQPWPSCSASQGLQDIYR